MTYVELWTDKGRECVARTGEGFLEDVFKHFHAKACRRRYAEEREHPEWVDHGGES